MESEIWRELREETKQKVIDRYDTLLNASIIDDYTEEERNGAIAMLEELFGKDNVQKPKKSIKTWDDVVDSEGIAINILPETCQYFSDEVINKAIATFKITKLIELGYGGLITDEEWENENVPKYTIIVVDEKPELSVTYWKEFIAFHTYDQCEEFIENNMELLKDYFILK